MKISQTVRIVIISVACAWIFDVFIGRSFIAKISTWPVLNKWHLIAPQAPIVINNVQQVRVSGSGDLLQAANLAKSKISSVVSAAGNKITVTGEAVNLTSDGLFATASSAFSPRGNYFVEFYDGTSAQVTATAIDPATGLEFFKADLNNVPVAPLGDSSQANAGDPVLFLFNSVQSFNFNYTTSFISSSAADIFGQVLGSDKYTRSFSVQNPGDLLPGEPALNAKGEIIGIWNGSVLISSNNLRQALDNYESSGSQFSRPSFGFSYQLVSAAESEILKVPQGDRVTDAGASNPHAAQTGLLAGDIITAVDGATVNQEHPLDEILQRHKPGDQLMFSVSRGGQILTLTVTAGVQK